MFTTKEKNIYHCKSNKHSLRNYAQSLKLHKLFGQTKKKRKYLEKLQLKTKPLIYFDEIIVKKKCFYLIPRVLATYLNNLNFFHNWGNCKYLQKSA